MKAWYINKKDHTAQTGWSYIPSAYKSCPVDEVIFRFIEQHIQHIPAKTILQAEHVQQLAGSNTIDDATFTGELVTEDVLFVLADVEKRHGLRWSFIQTTSHKGDFIFFYEGSVDFKEDDVLTVTFIPVGQHIETIKGRDVRSIVGVPVYIVKATDKKAEDVYY